MHTGYYTLLAADMEGYSIAHGLTLTNTQARALAAKNVRKITASHLTRAYWRQVGKIVDAYLRNQPTKDRLFGTFAA